MSPQIEKTRISIICPVKNEIQFIGYSVMSMLPHVHEFVYAIAPSSDDGTVDLLRHIAKKYGQIGGKIRLLIQSKYDFDPHDMNAYNESFQDCIEESTGNTCAFIHPDMVVTKWNDPPEGPLAWWTNVTSYARDMTTVITKGRCSQWKNLHAKKFGLRYLGGYGSANEDFYHSDITGKSLKHFGTDFQQYPFEVANSGIEVAHFCELKPYKRRLEKMKLCLKTQHPSFTDGLIEEMAVNHPRVTLEQSSSQFGQFEFTETVQPIPEVFTKYKDEFESFQKEKVLAHG